MSVGADAQVGGAVAVNLDAQFGLVELERGVGIQQAQRGRVGAQPLGVGVQQVEVRPEQREVDVEVGAAADEGLRVADGHPHVRQLPQAAANLLLDVALGEVALKRLPGGPVQQARPSGRCAPRAAQAGRKKLAPLTPPRKPLPAVASTRRTPGIARSSSSICKATRFIAARLVPSGAVTRTSNSPSSTLLGRYSCRTSL